MEETQFCFIKTQLATIVAVLSSTTAATVPQITAPTPVAVTVTQHGTLGHAVSVSDIRARLEETLISWEALSRNNNADKVFDEMLHPNSVNIADNAPDGMGNFASKPLESEEETDYEITSEQEDTGPGDSENDEEDDFLPLKADNPMVEMVGQSFPSKPAAVEDAHHLFDKIPISLEPTEGDEGLKDRGISVVCSPKELRSEDYVTVVSSINLSSKSKFELDVNFWVDGLLVFTFDPGGYCLLPIECGLLAFKKEQGNYCLTTNMARPLNFKVSWIMCQEGDVPQPFSSMFYNGETTQQLSDEMPNIVLSIACLPRLLGCADNAEKVSSTNVSTQNHELDVELYFGEIVRFMFDPGGEIEMKYLFPQKPYRFPHVTPNLQANQPISPFYIFSAEIPFPSSRMGGSLSKQSTNSSCPTPFGQFLRILGCDFIDLNGVKQDFDKMPSNSNVELWVGKVLLFVFDPGGSYYLLRTWHWNDLFQIFEDRQGRNMMKKSGIINIVVDHKKSGILNIEGDQYNRVGDLSCTCVDVLEFGGLVGKFQMTSKYIQGFLTITSLMCNNVEKYPPLAKVYKSTKHGNYIIKFEESVCMAHELVCSSSELTFFIWDLGPCEAFLLILEDKDVFEGKEERWEAKKIIATMSICQGDTKIILNI